MDSGTVESKRHRSVAVNIVNDQRVRDALFNGVRWSQILSSSATRLFRSLLSAHSGQVAAVLFGNLLLVSLKALETIYVLSFLKLLVDDATQVQSHVEIAGLKIPVWMAFESPLASVAMIAVGAVVAHAFLHYLLTRESARIQTAVLVDVRKRILRKVVSKNLQYYSESKVSEILHLMNTVVGRFSDFFQNFQLFLAGSLATLITLFLMVKLIPALTLGICGALALVFIAQSVFRKRMIRLAFDAEIEGKKFAEEFINLLFGIRLIKQSGREKQVIQQASNTIWKRETAQILSNLYNTRISITYELGFVFCLLVFFMLVRQFQILPAHMMNDIGVLLPFLYLSLRLIRDLKGVATCRVRFTAMYPQFVIVGEFLEDQTGETSTQSTGKTQLRETSTIDVKDLRFSYDGSKEVIKLDQLSFHKGTATALVGFSGSGKSTLLDLIARNYEAQGGEILFDGTSVSHFDSKSFYSKVGYASQETVIFNGSFRENLLFCIDDASDEQIERALYLSCADEVLGDLENGLDSFVGERGFKISGGQRQRLNLARILIKDPQILLLDEATNSLDLVTEARVYQRILSLKKDKVVIVAAHRLSTIQEFDQIVVVHQGSVVEKGNHAELMKNQKLYASLYRVQEYEQKERTSEGGREKL